MKLSQLAIYGYAVLFLAAGGVNSLVSAAEESAPAKNRTEELREQLKQMSPAEREAKFKEWREKYQQPRPEREFVEKRREELKNLSPAERQIKFREWRAAAVSNAPVVRPFTTEEREAKRKELRFRLQAQMENVRTNKTVELSVEERKQFLQRMQEVAKSFDHSTGESRPQTGSPGEVQNPAEK